MAFRYEHGTYNRICDRSGVKGKRSDMVREFDTGLIVLARHADPPHPLKKPQRPIKDYDGILD